jgi:hypothetical protein
MLYTLSYPKKFGLMRRNITPDAHKIASQIITFLIIFFPAATLFGSAHQVEIITPPIMIKTKETIKIAVTNIFISAVIKTGKASPSAIFPPCAVVAMQLPIKGTEVFSLVPQHTLGLVQRAHAPLPFSCP